MLSDYHAYSLGMGHIPAFLQQMLHANPNIQAELSRLMALEQVLPTETDKSQLFDLPSLTSDLDTAAMVVPVTVMFADLRGFTSFVEEYPPKQVIRQLNEYFACMTRIVVEHGGILDKYMGDEIMAYFECDSPLEYISSATHAVLAATQMAQALQDLNHRWENRGWPTLKSGIGINSGPVLKGTIGSMVKMETTIIGDTVNVASRLQQLNKDYDTQILLSDTTYKLVQASLNAELLGEVQIRGRKKPLTVYGLNPT